MTQAPIPPAPDAKTLIFLSIHRKLLCVCALLFMRKCGASTTLTMQRAAPDRHVTAGLGTCSPPGSLLAPSGCPSSFWRTIEHQPACLLEPA